MENKRRTVAYTEKFHGWVSFSGIWWSFVCGVQSKQSCPENFRCIDYTFYIQDFEQLALALKNRVALEFFTVLNILFTFRIFE